MSHHVASNVMRHCSPLPPARPASQRSWGCRSALGCRIAAAPAEAPASRAPRPRCGRRRGARCGPRGGCCAGRRRTGRSRPRSAAATRTPRPSSHPCLQDTAGRFLPSRGHGDRRPQAAARRSVPRGRRLEQGRSHDHDRQGRERGTVPVPHPARCSATARPAASCSFPSRARAASARCGSTFRAMRSPMRSTASRRRSSAWCAGCPEADAVAAVVVYATRVSHDDGMPHRDLIEALETRADACGLRVTDALCVAADAWGSHLDPGVPRAGARSPSSATSPEEREHLPVADGRSSRRVRAPGGRSRREGARRRALAALEDAVAAAVRSRVCGTSARVERRADRCDPEAEPTRAASAEALHRPDEPARRPAGARRGLRAG